MLELIPSEIKIQKTKLLLKSNKPSHRNPMKKKVDFYEKIEEELILRDYLAIERTRLANETALLAYFRTGLFLLSIGLTFIQLKEFKAISLIGWFCLPFSFLSVGFGIYRFVRLNSQMKKNKSNRT